VQGTGHARPCRASDRLKTAGGAPMRRKGSGGLEIASTNWSLSAL
jgi:hypothetical protein